MSKEVIVIRSNTLKRETRATKIIKTFSESNCDVTFLGWDRNITTSRSEKDKAGDLDKEIYLNLNATSGGFSIVLLPVWWLYVFCKLLTKNWDLAYTITINSAPPVILAGKIMEKKVIYDLLEIYEDNILYRNGEFIFSNLLRNVILYFDKILMENSSGVVLADIEQVVEVNGIPNENVVPIYDSPPADDLKKDNISKSYFQNDEFVIFYAGILNSGKSLNLDKMLEAIKEIEDVKLVIAGYGDLKSKIKGWEDQHPQKVKFLGEISHTEVLERSYLADMLFVLRDTTLPVNKYICGSKVLEAMLCETPIIANKNTSTAEKVKEGKFGFVVDANNIEEIKQKILKLKKNEKLKKQMSKNAKKMYENKYGWNIMAKKLIDLLNELFS